MKKMSYKIVVVIPVHKEAMTFAEKQSLLQCKKILSNYAVVLLHPAGMNSTNYKSVFPSLQLYPVEPKCLNSLQAYNKTKCSLSFYTLFQAYDFMLTYELDAYIFSDNWNKANCFEYDYIGAPWFENYGMNKENTSITGVGNSGFSMRNIKKCIEVLELREKTLLRWQRFKKVRLHKIIRFALLLRIFDSNLWNIKGINYYFDPFTIENYISEDIFWGTVVPKLCKFKIAGITNSIKFSFEVNPLQLYKMNQYQLPLGCHAWEKYDPEFWKDFIQ